MFKKIFFTIFYFFYFYSPAFAKELSNKLSHDSSPSLVPILSITPSNNSEKFNSFTSNLINNKNTKKKTNNPNESGIILETSVENGKGISFENVYNNNRKISKLTWKFDNILMSKIRMGIIFDDLFELNLSYSTSNNNSYKNGKMTDLDWLGENGGGNDGNTDYNNWTHYSHSVVKTNIQEFDIHTRTIFYKKISINAGYRQQEFEFEDKTQNYIYSCDLYARLDAISCVNGLRNISNDLKSINHINYNQRFRIPYIGIGLQDKFFNNKLAIDIFGAYSNAVFADDYDHHVVRSKVTTGKFYRGKYYNFGGNISYKFYENFAMRLGYEYSEIPLIKGNSKIISYDPKYLSTTTKNGAGLSSKFEKISFGLSYLFFLN